MVWTRTPPSIPPDWQNHEVKYKLPPIRTLREVIPNDWVPSDLQIHERRYEYERRICKNGVVKYHLSLYRENPDKFIEYFKHRDVNEKKNILKSLLEYDFINEKVVDWLNENESKLVRDVGLNSI